MLAYLTPRLGYGQPQHWREKMTDETVVGTTEPIKKVVSMGDRRYDTQKTIEDEEKELEELIQQQKDDADIQEKKDKVPFRATDFIRQI